MRLFTGIDIPEEQRARIGRLLDQLKPSAKLRWSKPDNLHVTTKFIGEWPEERLEEVKSALAGVAAAPLPVGISGLGWFPNPHQPRIFWVGVRGGEALKKLAAGTERALEAVGIAREDREYTPHLTLARVEAGTPVGDLRRAVAGLDSTDFGEWTAAEHVLYMNEPVPGGGSRYTRLAMFPLEGDK
jgi:2'-5' RNA ligase